MEQEITQSELPELRITEEAKQYLKATSSWTMFYAVICFISVGIMVLSGLFMLFFGGIMTLTGEVSDIPFTGFYAIIGIIYIIFGGVMILPSLYLYRFSEKVSKALPFNNTEILTNALENMKSYWKFMGIMTIVCIGLCVLIVPISFIFAALSGLWY